MSALIFLDANIFMYAAGAEHPYKSPCLRILSDVETGTITAVINTEILQEILYRYSHIHLPEKGIELCQAIIKYPIEVLPVTSSDIKQAIELYSSLHSSGLKPRDAVHAATMQNNHITHLASADKEFDQIPSIDRVDPITYSTN
jgi:hypothetical protein